MKLDKENLHSCGLNKHFPRAVLYGPLRYGGLGTAPLHSKCIADKLLYFLHHSYLQEETGSQMNISMGYTQLECGCDTPFFEQLHDDWGPLCMETWITHLWAENNKKNIILRSGMGNYRTPKLQREWDYFLMDFAMKWYEGNELWAINNCCISLPVITLADITSLDGKVIIMHYYKNRNKGDSIGCTSTYK